MLDRRYLIASYTRADAIADGQLVEIDRSVLQEAGVCLPAVLSAPLLAALEPTLEDEKRGQSLQGRLWDMLMVFRAGAKNSEANRLEFALVLATEEGFVQQQVVAVCGPDDEGNPCLTFMTPGCD